SGFWGFFYRPILDRYRAGAIAVEDRAIEETPEAALDLRRAGTLGFTPIHISEYLRRFPPAEEVEVHRGAWNTEHHWGGDFTQWTGSLLQKKGWDEMRRASDYYWEIKERFEDRKSATNNADEVGHLISRAFDRLLAAETSCNFYWGSNWV